MNTRTSRGLLLWLLCLIAGPAAAEEERKAFRVCADPNNLPFSHQNEQGFENRLAELWAGELGVPVEYTWFPQRRGFIRNTLRSQDPATGQYKCDVVMGIPPGAGPLSTTKPYYRSTYALVYAKGRGLDEIQSVKDLLALDSEQKEKLRIGVFTPSPATVWLTRYGLNGQMVGFPAMSGDPNSYPGEIVEKELVEGRIDAAILWGPIAGYFAKKAVGVELEVLPMRSEPGIRFDFAIAAGVRRGESQSKRELEDLIDRTSEQVTALLGDYNVPLLSGETEN